jgi:hypothetical protein
MPEWVLTADLDQRDEVFAWCRANGYAPLEWLLTAHRERLRRLGVR